MELMLDSTIGKYLHQTMTDYSELLNDGIWNVLECESLQYIHPRFIMMFSTSWEENFNCTVCNHQWSKPLLDFVTKIFIPLNNDNDD